MARAQSNDRPVLIPHVDDLGVSHGANQAFIELSGLGFVICGSVMPPARGFPRWWRWRRSARRTTSACT